MTLQEMAHEAVTRWKNGEFRSANPDEVHDWGFIMKTGEAAKLYEFPDKALALVVTGVNGILELLISNVDGEGVVANIETGEILSTF